MLLALQGLKVFKDNKGLSDLLVPRGFKAHRVSKVHLALPGPKVSRVHKAFKEQLDLLVRKVSRGLLVARVFRALLALLGRKVCKALKAQQDS